MGDNKMLQMVLNKITALDKKLDSKIDSLDTRIEKGFYAVNKRLDTIGSNVAFIEDDTPTLKDHEKLDKRVKKLEQVTLN